MTLAVYPLVYLPVAASLRAADPGQEEVARSLGVGRLRRSSGSRWARPAARSSAAACWWPWCMLAEYGAFEILGYQTFTTEIFTEFSLSFSVPAACALSLVLVALSLLVLAARAWPRGRGRVSRAGPLAARSLPPQRLGRGHAARAGRLRRAGRCWRSACRSASSIYWMVQGGATRRPAASPCSTPPCTPPATASAPAALDTAAALPVALLAVRHPGRARHLLERSTYLVLAMPGLVAALRPVLLHRALRRRRSATRRAPLLVLCYAIMFFPLALVGVKASVARAPASLDDVARSLGQRRLAVLLRVTLRLVAPGLAAAFCLVFLSVVTELTATLMLIPTGVQTLATQFWAYQNNLSYARPRRSRW